MKKLKFKIFIYFLLFIFCSNFILAGTDIQDKTSKLENINENFTFVFYLLLGLLGILFIISIIMIISHFGYKDLRNISLLILVLIFFAFIILV